MILNEVLRGVDIWLIPLLSIASSTAVSGVVGYIIKRSLDKHFREKDKRDQKIKDEHEELQRIKEEQFRKERKEDLKETIENAIKPLEDKVDNLHEKLLINSEGTVTILRDRMKSSRDAFIERGFATDSDKANWKELYQSYKALGGNHFKEYVDQWKNSIEELPPHKIRKNSKDKKENIEN